MHRRKIYEHLGRINPLKWARGVANSSPHQAALGICRGRRQALGVSVAWQGGQAGRHAHLCTSFSTSGTTSSGGRVACWGSLIYSGGPRWKNGQTYLEENPPAWA